MDLWIAHNVEQVHFTKTRLTIYHKNNKIIIFTPYVVCVWGGGVRKISKIFYH